MSGDKINNLKLADDKPSDLTNLEYTQKLLEPFEDILIERFSPPLESTKSKRSIFNFIAIGLVLFINFPKVREKSGINDYILWLISLLLLLGTLY
jgi:hypothetical protein